MHNERTTPIPKKIGLAYTAPIDFAKLLHFFGFRQLQGVELISEDSYSRTARIERDGTVHEGWIRVTQADDTDELILEISEGLLPVAGEVQTRVRQLFDLDCDPITVHNAISSLNDVVEGAAVLGTRVPGAFEPFETACRAILGQQVSVLAANKLAARIVENFGIPVSTGIEGLDRAFPTARAICAIGDIEEAFGNLGVISNRSRVIKQIAQMVEAGDLDLTPRADAEAEMEKLVSIKGIGPWTANYIAMRTMSHTDAFLETDIGIKHALPDLKPKERLQAAEQWRPWRSYANISLWNSLG